MANERCTCGYRRFRESRATSTTTVSQWFLYDTGGGFGATPLGGSLGAGLGVGEYGLFSVTTPIVEASITCESCQRRRSQRTLVTGAFLGGYRAGSRIYIPSTADVDAACLYVRFEGPFGEVFLQDVKRDVGPLQPVLTSSIPLEGPVPTPGAGLVADTRYSAPLPVVSEDGIYEVTLVNTCTGYELELGSVYLENTVITLNPSDADLNGAPAFWVEHAWKYKTNSVQPQQSAVRGIPFDRVQGVIEYDARFGTDPAAQGFTKVGTGPAGDFSLASAGVLALNSAGGDIRYTQSLALASAPTQVFTYSRAMILTGGAGGFDGLTFDGFYSDTGDTDYKGGGVLYKPLGGLAIVTGRTGLSPLTSAANPLGASFQDLRGWQNTGLVVNRTQTDDVYWNHNDLTSPNLSVADAAGAAPLSNELYAQFGVHDANATTGYIRNFVVSAGGRFMRPWFQAYTGVSSPVLRLYLTAESDGSGDDLARFRVRYGSVSPYVMPPNIIDASVAFTARNTMYEVPITLAGLVADKPFWFTIERDWTHADDRTDATAWLMQATVRGL